MSSNLADLPLVSARSTLPPILTSSGQDEFKFGISTPRSATRSTLPGTISSGQDEFKFGQIYLPVLTSRVKMSSNLADLPPVLTSSGQDEFKFGRSTPNLPSLVLTSSGQDEFKFGRSTPRSSGQDEF